MPEVVRVLVPIRSNGIVAHIGVDMSEQCAMCRHKADALACLAFEHIPASILDGSHDHRKPYLGDHGIRFEPVKKPEP